MIFLCIDICLHHQELIKRENVTAVISMNEDHELKMFVPNTEEWARLGVEFLQLPTRDYVEVPSLENLKQGVELIERHVNFGESVRRPSLQEAPANSDFDFPNEEPSSSGSTSPEPPRNPTVYVHCKAGRTRSATLVACYLVKVSAPLVLYQILVVIEYFFLFIHATFQSTTTTAI